LQLPKDKLENFQQSSHQLLGRPNFYQDSICHEVKYDPTDKKSDTYKKYIKPFSYGTPEQWLKFMEDLNIVIHGNEIDKNSSAHFNLTHSSLKDEALCIFNELQGQVKEK
jgi:hypothetical protein